MNTQLQSLTDGVTLQKQPSFQQGETLRGCPETAGLGQLSEYQKYSQIVEQMLPTVKVVP